MTVQTANMQKQPLRLLKRMRKYHRKLRSHPLHRDAYKSLGVTIKIKQDTFYFEQSKAAKTRFEKLMKHLASKGA